AVNVQLPVDYRSHPAAPRADEPRYKIAADENARLAEIKLEQRATKPFKITLEGTYGPPQESKASLELPKIQEAVGKGPHKVVIQLPENVELMLPRERDPAWEIEKLRYNRQGRTSEQLPERVELAWQPHRQELLLASVADVALIGNFGQVVQQIWFASGQAPA